MMAAPMGTPSSCRASAHRPAITPDASRNLRAPSQKTITAMREMCARWLDGVARTVRVASTSRVVRAECAARKVRHHDANASRFAFALLYHPHHQTLWLALRAGFARDARTVRALFALRVRAALRAAQGVATLGLLLRTATHAAHHRRCVMCDISPL